MLSTVLTLIAMAACLVYYYSTRTYDYWRRRGVKGPTPTAFVGNLGEVTANKNSFGRVLERIYAEYPDEKYVGIFMFKTPQLIIKDLDLIKNILIKDFDYFADRGIHAKSDVFHQNLAFSDVDTWRVLRQKLSPVFTSGKLKNMFYLVDKCANGLEDYIEKLIGSRMIEARDFTDKYTMEVIGSCAFGVEVNAFDEEECIFSKMSKAYSERQRNIFLIEHLIGGVLAMFEIKLIRKDVVEFFTGLVRQLIKEREGKPKVRHDFMDLLIDLREQGTVKSSTKNDSELSLEMTEVLITAQAVIFYTAGFETTGGLLSFMLHELALNQDVQEKLREEVDCIYKKYGDITYESINKMEYLELVMCETLRKYTVAEVMPRKCLQNYQVPGGKLLIEKGVTVYIPISAIHHDPKLYPEPDKFIPERFAKVNKQNMDPLSFIPFGEGPRICIGKRFAKMTASVGISKILRKFKVIPTAKSFEKLTFDALSGTLKADIWVNFEKRIISD